MKLLRDTYFGLTLQSKLLEHLKYTKSSWHRPMEDEYKWFKEEIKMELTPQMVLLKFDCDASEVLECFIDFPYKDPIFEKDTILIKTLPLEEFFYYHIRYCNQEGAAASDFFPNDERGRRLHNFFKPTKEDILEYFEHWNVAGLVFTVHFCGR